MYKSKNYNKYSLNEYFSCSIGEGASYKIIQEYIKN